jgi:Uma2 family endonuclease
MTAAAPKLPTFAELYAEIERLPEGATGEILEPGVVHVTMGRPGRAHRYTFKRGLRALSRFDIDEGGIGWWIEPEPEVRFGPRLLVPDLAGWRVARVPELPEENPIEIAPDWCCEMLSPSTARVDRVVKLGHYLRAGVPWVWLVDPILHTIEVYERDEKGRPALATIAEEADSVTLPPFDGEIAVAPWWLPAAPAVSPPPGAVAPARALRSTRGKRGKR